MQVKDLDWIDVYADPPSLLATVIAMTDNGLVMRGALIREDDFFTCYSSDSGWSLPYIRWYVHSPNIPGGDV